VYVLVAVDPEDPVEDPAGDPLEDPVDDEPVDPCDVDFAPVASDAPEVVVSPLAEGIAPRLSPWEWGWKRSTPARPAAVPATTSGARRIRTRTSLGGCGRLAPRVRPRLWRRRG
jgi:hypothetical protein